MSAGSAGCKRTRGLFQREMGDFPVFRSFGRQLAFPQEEFRDFKSPEDLILLLGEKFLELRLRAGNLESCERQMRAEGAVFGGKSDIRHCCLNPFCQHCQIRRGIESDPEDAWAFCVRAKSITLSARRELWKTADSPQSFFHLGHLLIGNLAEELQREVDPLGARPAGVRTDRAEACLFAREGAAKLLRQFNGNERTHRWP